VRQRATCCSVEKSINHQIFLQKLFAKLALSNAVWITHEPFTRSSARRPSSEPLVQASSKAPSDSGAKRFGEAAPGRLRRNISKKLGMPHGQISLVEIHS